MKALRIVIVSLFLAVLILPMVYFNDKPNSISEIDNRKLTENPFTLEGDLTDNIENYVNDRIGFRDDIITSYIVLNDKLFNKMVHPSYKYGKDGYVFGAGLTTSKFFGDYYIEFANMVKSIQEYCKDRGVPFVFVFNPAKPAVYQDKIADGINYNRYWVDRFLEEIEKREVNLIDNTVFFQELRQQGINSFNKKYDANHWNYTGAFYGVNNIIKQIKSYYPNVNENSIEDFEVSQILKETLLNSKFPINEEVPYYKSKFTYSNLKDNYKNIKFDNRYKTFNYCFNENEKVSDTPKVLMFQGSYMNSYGVDFMANAFKEYISIHDYQNVINLPYYFNIFKPNVVVFEVAEYTFNNTFFDYSKMKAIDYNPLLSKVEHIEIQDVGNNITTTYKDDTLTTILYSTNNSYKYVWLELDCVYDMVKTDKGYEVTIDTNRINDISSAKIYVST